MKKLIEAHDPPSGNRTSGLFSNLVTAVVGQQLSDKAAATIVERIKKLIGNPIWPRTVLAVSDKKLRETGISYSKVSYIKGLAQTAVDGGLNKKKFSKLSDEDVLQELTKLKGIGPWTAEMVLMFTLNRPDVFSIGDLGLRTAVAKLYNVSRNDTEKILKISEKWKPYRTLASWYLWKSID